MVGTLNIYNYVTNKIKPVGIALSEYCFIYLFAFSLQALVIYSMAIVNKYVSLWGKAEHVYVNMVSNLTQTTGPVLLVNIHCFIEFTYIKYIKRT